MRTARELDRLPPVVLDTRERLFLPAGSVEETALPQEDESRFRYRYRGLRLLIQGDGRLFLVGDAAHIITPMGGKGMNLALADAEVLARAVRSAVRDGDEQPLRAYSKTCLDRTWSYQEYSRWMTEMLHDSGDPATAGPFRHKLARARLDRLFTSANAGGLFAELMASPESKAQRYFFFAAGLAAGGAVALPMIDLVMLVSAGGSALRKSSSMDTFVPLSFRSHTDAGPRVPSPHAAPRRPRS